MHPKISAVDEAGAVRAENFRAWRLTEVSPGCTRLEYTCSLDLKGHFPKFIANTIVIPMQVLVQRMRPWSCRHALITAISCVACADENRRDDPAVLPEATAL
jgi:hypothetical protein